MEMETSWPLPRLQLCRLTFVPAGRLTFLCAAVTVAVAVAAFDCEVGRQRSWPHEKQKWCCRHKHLGCLEKSPEAFVEVSSDFGEHICHGEDREIGDCAPQPACRDCEPTDCQFSSWGPWYDSGGCVGLMFRHREIEVQSNPCGKPCVGAKIESLAHVKAECRADIRDCAFESWSEWSACESIMDQAIRTRGILQPPSADGAPCVGNLRQTRPCGGPARQDCMFSEWREWTQCSASCGEGRHSRMRRIDVESLHGGETCNDNVLEVKPCTVQGCPKQDCTVSAWSEWSTCPSSGKGQRNRFRAVQQPALGDGRPCPPDLMQTAGCAIPRSEDCEVTEWSGWGDCTKSCMGGERYRERQMISPSKHGGNCPRMALKAVEACSEGPCETEVVNCSLSEWSNWSQCSVSVGKGAKSRVRVIAIPASAQGDGCDGPLAEVAGCVVHEKDEVDCVWAKWDQWSACSDSCGGGGLKHRSRVIERSAEHGGKQCPAEVKSEIAPCNTHECDEGCVDAEWTQWLEWTECTATCSSGYMSRARSLRVEANTCGRLVNGLREEFKLCEDLGSCVEERDCVLSEWEDWSHCSCSCFGVRERNRHIAIYSSGAGAPCSDKSLKVVQPCNPVSEEDVPAKCGADSVQDCVLSTWSQWTSCTAQCGGGQMRRKRDIISQAKGGGEPCDDALVVTQACNAMPCIKVECQDCEWNEWSDWSECAECGGERTRHRAVKKLPNHCGKPCDHRSVKEVSTCTSKCEAEHYCSWSAWTTPKCTGRCGQQTAMRSRELRLWNEPRHDYLFKASNQAECRGTQLSAVACQEAPHCESSCKPRHCVFGEWGEWAAATCVGLCERQRVITEMNNECGEPCNGDLLETKHCPALCTESKDCVLSSWGMWTHCGVKLDGQKFRSRKVLQQPRYDGMACNAPLNETRACDVPDPEPCRMESWSTWTPCSKTCGVGVKIRKRGVASTALNGGDRCTSSLEQIEACADQDCEVEPRHSCILAPWEEWTNCNTDGQKARTRVVARAASGGGDSCVGVLHQTLSCTDEASDCQMSDWTKWDECDRSCGAGQTRRHREILNFPKNGGKLCLDTLLQTKGCNNGPCDVMDCLVSGWAVWSACSTLCGAGMRSRDREIIRLRGEGGAGCFWELGETQACLEQPSCGIKDCKLSEWSHWGDCSVSCNGGFRKRSVEVVQMPDVGGVPCPSTEAAMTQVEPCKLDDCKKTCIDGHFGPWSNWSPCTVTCGGGETFRIRKVAKTANECGLQPEGVDREDKFCNVDVPCDPPKDCIFDEWTAWSDCSTSCTGVKRRSRTIKQYGRGIGKFCDGSLKETWPCNPAEGEAMPQDCLPPPDVDCILSDWEGWSSCSASCGGGMHMRSRSIVQHPLNEGMACKAALSEIRECARASCGGPAAVDCAYGEFEEWGACTSCDGESKRVRKIITYAQHGGRACTAFDSEEVQACPRKCGEILQCSWSAWDAWSRCSAPCGSGGNRHRARHLMLSDSPPSDLNATQKHKDTTAGDASAALMGGGALRRYEVLYRETAVMESQHFQEIVAAFGAGCVTLLAALAVVRAMDTGRRALTGARRLSTTAGPGAFADGFDARSRSGDGCNREPRSTEYSDDSRVPLVRNTRQDTDN